MFLCSGSMYVKEAGPFACLSVVVSACWSKYIAGLTESGIWSARGPGATTYTRKCERSM